MNARKIDLCVGAATVLAGILALVYLIPTYIDEGFGFGLSPRGFPYVCAAAITALGALLVLLRLRPAPGGDRPSPIDARALRRLAGVLLVLVLTLALMEWAGFIVSGAVTVAILMWLMGERRWLPLVATSLGWTLFLWVLFDRILATPLP